MGLTKIFQKNCYSLPLTSKLIDCLAGARYLTKLDICEAYHRLRMVFGDEWKIAFHTRYGHYKFTVVLFGLVIALAAI